MWLNKSSFLFCCDVAEYVCGDLLLFCVRVHGCCVAGSVSYCFSVLLYCLLCVSDQRLQAVIDLAILRWFGFVNPKGSNSFNSKGWFGEIDKVGVPVLDSDIPGLLRSAGQVFSVTPSSILSFYINLSHIDCYRTVKLERAIIPAAWFRGLLVRGS
jgi:hypothetical protein